jgi:hypothetical protein
LDPTTTFAISEHLRSCNECQRRFDSEREVDQLVVAGLEVGNVPEELWRGIVRPLRRPRWARWRLYAPLAAAAVIVLVAWMGRLTKPDSPQPHWAVKEFLAETNGGRPFPVAGTVSSAGSMRMALEPFPDVALDLAGEAALRHVVQMVRLETRVDADGGQVAELRLNCCGEPVILRVARQERPGRLREFVGADRAKLASMSGSANVAVGERDLGEYVVVAVSRHPVAHILGAVRVQ